MKLRKIFADRDMMAEIEGKLAGAYNVELTNDEEHSLWEIDVTFSNG